MNTFADSVLSLLLGWVRNLIQSIWSALSGDSGVLLYWLYRHWLLLAVGLSAAGLFIDWVIYLLRWRPYYVWKTAWRRLRGKKADESQEQGFLNGYAEAVPYAFGAPEKPGEQSGESFITPEMMAYYDAAVSAQPSPSATPPIQRRRRSGRQNRPRLFREVGSRVRDAFAIRDENDLYGETPAPPVRQNEAFHEPVYPSQYLDGMYQRPQSEPVQAYDKAEDAADDSSLPPV